MHTTFLRERKTEEAKILFEQLRTMGGVDPNVKLDAILNLGMLASTPEQGRVYFKDCLASAEQQKIPSFQVLALSELGVSMTNSHDEKAGQKYFHQLMEVGKANNLESTVHYMGAAWNIAVYENAKHNYREAVSAANESIKTMSKIYGNDHAGLVAMLRLRAGAYSAMGTQNLAEADSKRALEIEKKPAKAG